MSDYTPTTEEVRANYLPPRTEIVDADEQFDRWLAEHDREVKAEAWEEGWDAGWQYALWMHGEHRTDNPYSEETE